MTRREAAELFLTGFFGAPVLVLILMISLPVLGYSPSWSWPYWS